MKTLTVCQPYASLIASGEKRIENRSWSTAYRGPLAVHAGRSRSWLDSYAPLPDNMTFGAVICVVDLVDCLPIDDVRGELENHVHKEGPVCWILENVRILREPLPWRGQQMLFDVPDELIMSRLG